MGLTALVVLGPCVRWWCLAAVVAAASAVVIVVIRGQTEMARGNETEGAALVLLVVIAARCCAPLRAGDLPTGCRASGFGFPSGPARMLAIGTAWWCLVFAVVVRT